MQLHNTKGIVLKTVKYGETSLITTVFTELFGVQTYLVKGARQGSKKAQGKAVFFQPAAILDMTVYHHEQKNLQYIKEYNWAYPYQTVLLDVVKNCVAMYMMEILQLTLKEPENNPDLYYLIDNLLQQLDKGSDALTANMPLHFMLSISTQLGFQIQGNYQVNTPILDLKEGMFVSEIPHHVHYISDEMANNTYRLMSADSSLAVEEIKLNRVTRKQLLEAYCQYFAIHIADFRTLKTLSVLQEVLS